MRTCACVCLRMRRTLHCAWFGSQGWRLLCLILVCSVSACARPGRIYNVNLHGYLEPVLAMGLAGLDLDDPSCQQRCSGRQRRALPSMYMMLSNMYSQ